MHSEDITIRTARANDAVNIAEMVRALANHEGVTSTDHITPEAIISWISGTRRKITILVADFKGSLLGYLAYYCTFSLFTGTEVLLVENLYVAPEARGMSVGQRLLSAAAKDAVKLGCARMELSVAEKNKARSFYEKQKMEFTGYLVYGKDIPGVCAPSRADSAGDVRQGA